MPGKSSNLGQFWQELKRRKVVRIIIVYAAAAYVILEAVDIIFPQMGFPDWTVTFVIFLLIIGFIISIILSWVYDITPDGIEKTKPVKEIKEEVPEKPSGIKAWKIATFISVVIIVGLIIFNIFGRREKVEDLAILDKSIAVRPFKSLSDDPEKQYLADGAMDAILLHLSKIEDLRVMSRTSVEQYRETDKTTIVIGEELNVAYLLEGSFQKYGDKAKLIVQLIKTSDDSHIWSNEYDRDWNDIFMVQSEVAQSIARELQAVITPEEKQLIEKIPTANLTAYDFYQRGREELKTYWLDNNNREALERAEVLYHQALEYDSSFAQAYTGLAWVYDSKRGRETYLAENYLDSSFVLADIALSFDNKLAEAYIIRGRYFEQHGDKEQALIEYDKAIRFNPNEWLAYLLKATLFFYGDALTTIDNYHKAASLHRGTYLPRIYHALGNAYGAIGFYEKSYFYINEALKLDNDSARFYFDLGSIEDCFGNFEKALEFNDKCFTIDSSDYRVLWLSGSQHRLLSQHKESLKRFKELVKKLGARDSSLLGYFSVPVGYAYLANGFNNEAQYYLHRGLEYHNKTVELGRHILGNTVTFYNLAAAYSTIEDVERALDNLRAIAQAKWTPLWVITKVKVDPMFDNIRDEPEFQQIVRELEVKYQTEHERVRKWLEEQGML